MSRAPVVEAHELTKRYGTCLALDHATFSIAPGRIVGLIGPNGAGKSTALRAILGLIPCEGRLSVMGREPFRERAALMEDASFIADVAVLPSWLRVDRAVEFVGGVQPRFRRERALALLDKAGIGRKRTMRELSKGMKAQVHLALTMAADTKFLVLDEPTLGLDVLARRAFHDALRNDYMDEMRTVLITTHQIEEVEDLLTDLLFIDQGRIVLDCALDALPGRFAAVTVNAEQVDAARALQPFHERRIPGGMQFYFEEPELQTLRRLGAVHTPSVSDLCVAKLSGRTR